jgi:hypothetical protein
MYCVELATTALVGGSPSCPRDSAELLYVPHLNLSKWISPEELCLYTIEVACYLHTRKENTQFGLDL